MKKHLKTFLIAIVLTFSFLFIGNVKAAFPSGWEDISTFTLPSGITPEDYKIIIRKGYYNGTEYIMTVIPKNNNSRFQVTRDTDVFPNAYIIENLQPNNSSYYAKWYQANSNKNFVYKGTNDRAHKASYKIVYTNADIYSSNGSDKWFSYDTLITSTINFHLNGGTIIDVSNPFNPQTYQENFTLELNQSDLNTFINSQTPINGNSEFLGWYYDANFTQPYNSSDTISSVIDLYAKYSTPITFNFHLNGGYVYDPSDGWGSEKDFSISLYNSEIEQFFTNLDVKKYLMLFDGWYYDNNYKNIFHINDNFTEDTYNLYAKWRYEKVDDFLDNTNFNEYTFDENYQYAIINRGNNGDSIYLGLPFSSFSLEVYEYNESTYKVKDGSSVCLTPIYTKNGFAIYDVNTLYTNDQEVLILPRILFDSLDPNDFQDPEDTHHFYLTDNAYVSYTNDLSEADIVDSNGEHITINLQDSYELSQQYHEIYSNPENIFAQVNIFLNKISKITSAIKGVFEYLFGSFNSTIQAFIIFLIVVVLISSIMRFIRRS